MIRPVNLTVVKGGIQRLRTKGGASPESLFDLVNGYVTADQKITSRPGTVRHASLPAGTKGLCSFEGKLHVFGVEHQVVPAGYVLHVIRHPDLVDDADNLIPLERIWFAGPFMGSLYVVAEFDTVSEAGRIFHYWLLGDENEAWEAETQYSAGELVRPTAPNGLYYKANRLDQPHPSWTPGTPRALGDTVEPTTYNDFYYEAVVAAGSNPRSGETEPGWPESEGAQVVENVAGAPEAEEAQPPEPPALPRSSKTRYTFRR